MRQAGRYLPGTATVWPPLLFSSVETLFFLFFTMLPSVVIRKSHIINVQSQPQSFARPEKDGISLTRAAPQRCAASSLCRYRSAFQSPDSCQPPVYTGEVKIRNDLPLIRIFHPLLSCALVLGHFPKNAQSHWSQFNWAVMTPFQWETRFTVQGNSSQ